MTAEPARESDGQASIDVAFTPADVRPADVALVVDVLRASTTIVAALAAGFERVLCVGDVEGARRLSGPCRELAGEKGCRPIEGFDYGNSPGAFTRAPVPELVLCTTNGTPAVLAAAEVAARTLALFRQVVPAAVPGIAFLSGGQSDEQASAHLSAMIAVGGVPWELSFSYGRALLGTPLQAWSGEEANEAGAQKVFAHRARCNGEARYGRYTEELERALAA